MIELIQSVNRILSEPHLAALFISIIIKSSLILIVAGLIITVFRGISSVIRSYILSLTFIVTLALPLLIFITPAWQFSMSNLFTSIINTTTPTVSNSGLQPVELASANNLSISALTVFTTIWITCTSILLIRLILGWFLMLRILKRSRTTDNHNITKLISNVSTKLKLRQPVKLTFSAEISSPVTIGLWNHVIIFPEYAQKWPMEIMEMSLTHELAHIKRYDTLWYLIGSITTALYWFNPLVWMCRKKLITEAEVVCDNYVLMSGNDPLTYAENLLGIARHISQKQFAIPVGVGMARKSELEGRLMSIMSDRKRIVSVKNSIFTLGILLTLVFVLPLSGVQLLAVETDHQTTPTEAYSTDKQTSDDKQKDKKAKQQADEKYPGPDDFIEVTTMVEMTTEVQPEYPEDAKKQKIEGDIWIKALVGKMGSVIKARISKSSGNKLLDESAINAAYGCKYKPAMQENKPVAVWVTYKVTFLLTDEKEIVK